MPSSGVSGLNICEDLGLSDHHLTEEQESKYLTEKYTYKCGSNIMKCIELGGFYFKKGRKNAFPEFAQNFTKWCGKLTF